MTLADGRIGLKRSPVCAGHGNGNLIRSLENIMRNRGMGEAMHFYPRMGFSITRKSYQ